MKWHRAGITVMLVAAALAGSAPVSAATSVTLNFSLPALPPAGGWYSIGIDHIPGGGLYEQFYESPTSQYNNNPAVPVTNAQIVVSSSPTTLTDARMEIYSRGPSGLYDPINGDGAVAMYIPKPLTGTKNIGLIKIPKLGEPNTGRFVGNVFSRDSVTAGRVRIDMFQSTGQPSGSLAGMKFDGFSASKNAGASYKTGPLWYGQYVVFITDDATGRGAIGFLNLSATETVFDIDLDIQCFGLDECQSSGTFANGQGRFHAVQPTRIVDTRSALGMPGLLTPGDGRNSDPNPNNRLASRLGHEFVVTDIKDATGGVIIPARGVSAVLINVTVVNGTSSGGLRLIPKPPRSDWLNDQSSYPGGNSQALGIYWSAPAGGARNYDTRAGLQLVKVGVGGRVRIESASAGNVHFIVDVVGWVDQGQPGQGGDRLFTVTPDRLLDTRNGLGTEQRPFGQEETRLLKVVGGSGVPADAKAVIGTLTAVRSLAYSFQTVWPAGAAQPVASVMNTEVGTTRPNMVMTGVGTDGKWSIFSKAPGGSPSVPSTELLFDVNGYFTDAAGSTGKITAVPSFVVASATSIPGKYTYAVDVTGVGGVNGVPALPGVSAVWVLITVNGGPSTGWITAYPSLTAKPLASNVNWIAGQTTVNLALVPVGSDGNIFVFNGSFDPATVAISVVGWVN